jgi:hypothetical protein
MTEAGCPLVSAVSGTGRDQPWLWDATSNVLPMPFQMGLAGASNKELLEEFRNASVLFLVEVQWFEIWTMEHVFAFIPNDQDFWRARESDVPNWRFPWWPAASTNSRPTQRTSHLSSWLAPQAARILSIGRTALYQLIWDGQLTPIHIGRSVLGSAAHVVSHAVGHDLGGTPAVDIPFFSILTVLLLTAGGYRWIHRDDPAATRWRSRWRSTKVAFDGAQCPPPRHSSRSPPDIVVRLLERPPVTWARYS